MSKATLTKAEVKHMCEGIELLHRQSERQGDGGEASILFFAVAAYLDERGIIDRLKAAATAMAESNRRQPFRNSFIQNG